MSTRRAWRTLHRKTLFTGGPIREIAVESVELPDGRVIEDYYQIRLPDYALVFAEMRDGRVPLFEQYRHGARRVCLTFPGGTLDEGEEPAEAAQRELREELGLAADEWTSLGAFVTNANQGCNTAHLFRATGCHVVSRPDANDLEDMNVVYLDRATLGAPELLERIGLASHVALLLLATR